MPAGLDASDEEVRQLAAEILSRDEYTAFRPDLAAWREVLGWLERWLEWIDRLHASSPTLYWLLLLAMLAVALGLLAHIVWTVSVALRMPPPESERTASGSGPTLLQRAEALARGGRFLDAARHVQLATLELLLKRRVIELDRSEPNRVLRRRLARARLAEAERGELLALLSRLEAQWFRDHQDDPELYRAWQALHRRLATASGAV